MIASAQESEVNNFDSDHNQAPLSADVVAGRVEAGEGEHGSLHQPGSSPPATIIAEILDPDSRLLAALEHCVPLRFRKRPENHPDSEQDEGRA